MDLRRLGRRGLVALVALVAASLGLVPAEAASFTYVALGDSYAAGPMIPAPAEPLGCIKSTNNYPRLLAQRVGATILRDATCSLARTRDMTATQNTRPGENPPQFDRLDAGVDLVTLQIGANDIGLRDIAETCARAIAEGASCRSKWVHDGRDELQERVAATAPLIGAVIAGIRDRAPGAKVLVLGYPGIFRIGAVAGCPAMWVDEEDALYLRGIHEQLNAAIAGQATAHGVTYVDVYAPSVGKTACDLPVLRWVEPLVPVHAAAPVHPNLTGMTAIAGILAAA